jgi:hypothetical protein
VATEGPLRDQRLVMRVTMASKSDCGMGNSPRRKGSPQCCGSEMNDNSPTSGFASTGVVGWNSAASRLGWKSSVTYAWYGSSPVIVAQAVN